MKALVPVRMSGPRIWTSRASQARSVPRLEMAVGAGVAVSAPTPVVTDIGDVDCRACEVEEATAVVFEYRQIPSGVQPTDGTEEVVERGVERILPWQQDAFEVGVAVSPIAPRAVVRGLDAHQVVKIDLVSLVILLLGEVELVGHLVGQVPRPIACFAVRHGLHAHCCEKAEHE